MGPVQTITVGPLEQDSSGWALRGVLVTSSPAKHQRAVLTCSESPVASSASRCAGCPGSSAGDSQDAAARAGAGIAPTVGPGSRPLLTSASSGPPPADGACRFRCWRSLARRRSSVRAVIRTRRGPPVSLPLVRAFAQGVGRRRHRLPCGDVTGRRCCRKGRCSGPSPWGGRVSSSAWPVRCAGTRSSSGPRLGACWKWEDVAAAILDCRERAHGKRRVGLGGGEGARSTAVLAVSPRRSSGDEGWVIVGW